MKNSKKIVYIIIFSLILFILTGSFIVYKLYLLNIKYPCANYDTKVELADPINVQTDRSLENKIIEGMHIRLGEKNYEETSITSDRGEIGYFYKTEGKIHFWVTVYEDEFPYVVENMTEKDINYLTKKYDIKEELDLVKYDEAYKDKKPNILSSTSKIKMLHWSKYFTSSGKNQSHKIFYEIKGDLKGFYSNETLNINSFNELNLYHNKKVYLIRITKEFYDLKDIKMILNSIYFE